MYKRFYDKTSSWFEASKSRMKFVTVLHDLLPIIMYISYPLLLLSMFMYKNELLLKAIIVPASVFVGITLLRIIVNEKRPYEALDIVPLVSKSTKGRSFPSRHTASAFIIAMLFLRYQTDLGVMMCVISVLIGITRIITGVHYLRDVLSGAAISIIVGILFFFVF